MMIPPLVAHRGYPLRYPENTLEGIEAALQCGVRYIEFDVQLSADGVPVLCHDADLRRTAGVESSVLETKWRQLQKISVHEPSRFAQTYSSVTMPALAEFVAMFAVWPQARAFVELKSESLDVFGVQSMTEKVLDVLRPVHSRCVIISDVVDALVCARKNGVSTGWIFDEWSEKAHLTAKTLMPEYLFCNYQRVPAGDSPLWAGSWQWGLYEISDPALARLWIARGADLIETDAIGEMLEALQENGVGH